MNVKYPIQKKVFIIACEYFPSVIHKTSGVEKLNQDQLGLEGWFRVELAKALEKTDLLVRINNKGVDLNLKYNETLELKAAVDLNIPYILKGAEHQPCLFLGKPRWKRADHNKEAVELEFKMKTNKVIELFQLKSNWFLGIIY